MATRRIRTFEGNSGAGVPAFIGCAITGAPVAGCSTGGAAEAAGLMGGAEIEVFVAALCAQREIERNNARGTGNNLSVRIMGPEAARSCYLYRMVTMRRNPGLLPGKGEWLAADGRQVEIHEPTAAGPSSVSRC